MDGHAIKGLPYDPPTDDSAVTKKWVLDQLANLPDTSVPVGTIAFWLDSSTPSGWFRCDGGTFNTQLFPKLHRYLSGLDVYTRSGTVPVFNDTWMGSVGVQNGWTPGKQRSSLTARPSTKFETDELGEHSHFMGETGEVSGDKSGGRFYPNTSGPEATSREGKHKHSISSGGDSITRPPTVTGYWIIKHD
jgi:hypothetical protein